jgi:hypothetical protein
MKETRCISIPNRYTSNHHMSEDEVTRSIRFPRRLWDAIDEDAKRCRRSSLKQIEALLTVYYDLDNIEINKSQFLEDGLIAPDSNHPLPMKRNTPAAKKRTG